MCVEMLYSEAIPARLYSVLITPLVKLILNSGSGFHFTYILFLCLGVKASKFLQHILLYLPAEGGKAYPG